MKPSDKGLAMNNTNRVQRTEALVRAIAQRVKELTEDELVIVALALAGDVITAAEAYDIQRQLEALEARVEARDRASAQALEIAEAAVEKMMAPPTAIN
jgi:hypothetical protein